MDSTEASIKAESERISQLIKLIDVKNEYKAAGIIRELISIALLATFIGLGVLQGTVLLTIGGVSIAVLAIVIAVHGNRIHHNKKQMELPTTGFVQIL